MESPRIRAILVVEPQRLTRGDLEDIGRMMKLLKHTHTLVLTPPGPTTSATNMTGTSLNGN